MATYSTDMFRFTRLADATRQPNVLADPATITHMALVSAATGTAGDFIFYWTADAAKNPELGDTTTVASSVLVMGAE